MLLLGLVEEMVYEFCFNIMIFLPFSFSFVFNVVYQPFGLPPIFVNPSRQLHERCVILILIIYMCKLLIFNN